MKFKVLYEYFDIVDADWFEVDEGDVRFVQEDGSHWIPKYMIKRILPLDKEYNFDEDDGKDN